MAQEGEEDHMWMSASTLFHKPPYSRCSFKNNYYNFMTTSLLRGVCEKTKFALEIHQLFQEPSM
jgi:hypothetical protein